jgi:hypothetical protein
VPDATLSLHQGDRALGQVRRLALLPQTLDALGKHYKFQDDRAVVGSAGDGAGRDPASAPARRQIDFVYDDGLRSYKTTKPSRA